jgi:VanZ family protein
MILRHYYKSIICFFVIIFLSLIPAQKSSDLIFAFPHIDKPVHFLMYFVLFIIVMKDLKRSNKETKRFIIFTILIIILFLSILIEFIQEFFIPGRFGSFIDVLANLSGLIIAVFFYFKTTIFSKKHLIL